MMKIIHTFLKDLKVSFQTSYVYFEIIMAFLFVLILLFVVPENFTTDQKLYAFIDSSVKSEEMVSMLSNDTTGGVVLVESKEMLKTNLNKDKSGIGVAIYPQAGKLAYDIVLQGYEDEKLRSMIENSLLNYMAEKMPAYNDAVDMTVIGNYSDNLTDRINLIPIFLVMNSSLLGLFIVAAYIFLDKDEGVIRAFAVTPAKVWQYLMSKMMMMMMTGLITGLITVAFVARLSVNYLHIIILLLVTNAFGTALGLLIASFFNTIMKAMGTMFVVIIVLAMSTISYFVPSFSPMPIKLLPSYPMLFAFRQAFLEKPDIGYIYLNVAGFALAAALLFIWANRRYKRTLTI